MMIFFLFLGPVEYNVKWRPKRKFNDQRDNAAIVLEYSNATPFRWKRGVFSCAYCSLSFGDFSGVKDHIVDHSNRVEAMRLAYSNVNLKVEISDLICQLCLAPMENLDVLVNHLTSIHNKSIKIQEGLGIVPFILTGNEFKCTHCDDTYELFSKLNTHLNKHYPNSICFQCGKAFSNVQSLKTHLTVHDTGEMINYKCTRCAEVFSNKTLRNKHVVSVHGKEKRYRCPYCYEYFKTYADRGKHLTSTHGKKIEYPCNFCAAVFAMYNQRTKHFKQVHMQKKEFSCYICSYEFVTAGQLRNHMIRHGGERKYQCQVCKKSYARPQTLREHMRVHNNDKQFISLGK